MHCARFLAALGLLILSGCTCVRESSATADLDQIRSHLVAQLHCQSLVLEPDGKDAFTGTGKNDVGDFTIKVRRQKEQIHFEGSYVEKARGSFSGSASWNRGVTSGLGFSTSRSSGHNSLSTTTQFGSDQH